MRGSAHQHMWQMAFGKVAAATRRSRRNREKRLAERRTPVPLAPPVSSLAQPDPVRIAVLAMERLGSASLRASCTGAEVRVAAPDEAIAAIFRAALSETARNRSTDRLIRVFVE